jgi:hypothetical protein
MHGSWLVRSSVGRRWSSPLRRSVDRVERIALATAIGLAVLAVPVAVLAGAAVQRAGDDVAIAQNATAHPATALLLRDAPDDNTEAMLGSARTLGEWRTLSGIVRTGQVDVSPGATAGTSVSIWINDAGRPVPPPLTEDQAYWRGVVTVIMVLLGLFAAITATFCGMHWLLNRWRLARWAADWRSIEPHWSGDH